MNTPSNRYTYILIALIPVFVYAMSMWLFEISADSSQNIKNAIVAAIKAHQISTPAQIMAEYKYRLIWLSGSLLSITAYVAAMVWSVMTFHRSCCPQQKSKILALGAILLILTLYNMSSSGSQPASAMFNIFDTTFQAVKSSMFISKALLHKVFITIYTINVLAVVTPVFILIAICSAISIPAQPPASLQDFFLTRMKDLNHGVMVGSMILLFGVIHMAAWMQWPVVMFENKELNKLALETFGTISLFWGIAFTLLLLCLYAAATLYWYSQTKKCLTEQQPDLDIPKWMTEHGFMIVWQKHIIQLSTMLTPLLAGSFNNGLQLFSGN